MVAEWLVARGARHLVLLSRGGAGDGGGWAKLEARGVRLLHVRADVARPRELQRALVEAAAQLPPLRGVLHLAGTLRDAVLLQQDRARLARVLAPKVDGSWNLHLATRELDLELFVCFSSIAAVFGSPGQSNHAAACAFEDALADHRRAAGLPALSIDWGVFAEVGAGVAGVRAGRPWTVDGVDAFTPAEGAALLDRLLSGQIEHPVVAAVDWRRFAAALSGAHGPLLEQHVAPPAGHRPDAADEIDLRRRLEQAPAARRERMLADFVAGLVARVMRCSSAELEPGRPLMELGLDSLMAVELRKQLARAAGFPIPASLVFRYPTIAAIAGHLAEKLAPAGDAPRQHDPEPPAASPAAPPTEPRGGDSLDDLLDEVEGLSDEEIERALGEEEE